MAAHGVQPVGGGGGWGSLSVGGGGSGGGGCWSAPWAALDGPLGRKLARIALGAAAVVVTIKLYSKYKSKQRRKHWAQAGQGVVVLHTFSRGATCPNVSAFALKVETFCRMAGITYFIDTDEPMGSKSMSPWITVNGQELDDSELIMEFLTKNYSSPVHEATSALTAEQQGIGRCVQVMLDEHTMGLMAMKRYVIDDFQYVKESMPERKRWQLQIFRLLFAGALKKKMWIRGVGRFTEQEVLFFLYRDLKALADILGKKPYLLGTQPTAFDAAVFANLTQALCACAPDVEVHVREKHDNLAQYFDRMKGKFWADWDEVLDK